MGFPGGTVVKNPPANAGNEREMGSISGSGRSSGGGNSNPLLHSCFGHPMEKGPWRATVYEVTNTYDVVNELAHVTIYYNTFYLFFILFSRKHFSP